MENMEKIKMSNVIDPKIIMKDTHDKWSHVSFIGWIFHRMNVQDGITICPYCPDSRKIEDN